MATISTIDPVNRIEGHLRIEMEVDGGVVTDAWVSGGLFRGMELILQEREPADAVYISQRICGVCPVSHAHASCYAAEAAYGIERLTDGARLVRNIIEGAQFLHSNILWFYNLAGLDFVNPLNALGADVASTFDLCQEKGLASADFASVAKRLTAFAENGQLSIFSGNWFDTGEYKLSPELDLVATTHYLQALEIQGVASEISGIAGGKMPHIMTSVPGGTAFYPTEEKLDDLLYRAKRILDWVESTLIPDTFAIAPEYMDVFGYGKGVGRYIAWGVFDDPTQINTNRYLPAGVVHDDLTLEDPDEFKITETTAHSYYKDDGTPLQPRSGVTEPEYTAYDTKGRYSWDKAPRYDGLPYEAGPLSRALVAYLRGNEFYKANIDGALEKLGVAGQIGVLQSTMGRVAARNIETLYVAQLEVQWIMELIEAIKGGDVSFFTEKVTDTGEGSGMWEAPRGALYHYEKIVDNKIEKYQIIIPSTWNISPRDADGVRGPMEEALIGCEVEDVDKPIHPLRVVHSFDPCIACAVHVSEPKTGKEFTTVTNPWGVR